MIIHAFIKLLFNYCYYCYILFTCFNKKELGRLQAVQNTAARLLTDTRHKKETSYSITPVLASLLGILVHFRIHF